MNIARIESFLVRYPIVGAFKFFRAATRDTVVIKVTADSGQVGWGQSVPSPTWSYETIQSVRSTIDEHLCPALVGADPFDEDEIRRTMDRVIAPSFSTGQPIAKAGVDLALFDLAGRALGQTAAERWGRPSGGTVTLSWTIDARSLDDVNSSTAEARARGYRHFNIKVGGDEAFDVAVCREVRRAAPDAFIWADANGGYDLVTALRVAPQLADLGLKAFEQPLKANNLLGFRKLRDQRALPILMDEPIVALDDLRTFHEMGLLDGVAMKVSRCGGLSESRRILEYMLQHGLLFFASGLTDPDLSLAASLLLYSAYDLQAPAALNGPQFLSGSILKTSIIVTGDVAEAPRGVGLGVEVDEAKLVTGSLPVRP